MVYGPPVAINQTVFTPVGTPVTFNILAGDSVPNGFSNLVLTAITTPFPGTLDCRGPAGGFTHNCTYSPPTGSFLGVVSATYKIYEEGSTLSSTATVTILVGAVWVDKSVTVPFETPTVINELASDRLFGTLAAVTVPGLARMATQSSALTPSARYSSG